MGQENESPPLQSCTGEQQGRSGQGGTLMNGFISYSHEDHTMFEDFWVHLTAVQRAFAIEIWTDHKIHAGSDWEPRIATAIEAAQVFVLLISPDFIRSDYVYTKEIPAIQTRRKRAGALVLPVVLKRCYWKMIAATLQAIPTADQRVRPIIDWRPRNNGYDRAREQIMRSIADHFGVRPQHINW
jgi:TIR domain